MKELFEQYGLEPIVRHQELSFDETTDTVNKHCVIYDRAITSDKVLALEEVAINDNYSLTKVPDNDYELDDWYCWFDVTNMKRKSVTGKNRIDSLSNLLKARYDDYTEQEREQIREVLRG